MIKTNHTSAVDWIHNAVLIYGFIYKQNKMLFKPNKENCLHSSCFLWISRKDKFCFTNHNQISLQLGLEKYMD